MKKVYIIEGHQYRSLSSLCRDYNIPRSTVRNRLKARGGTCLIGGAILVETELEESQEKKTEQPENKVWNSLQARYSPQELSLLADGINPVPEKPKFPKPQFKGKHFRIGAMSDLHIGSKYCSDEYILAALKVFEEANVDFITLGGDITDGLSPKRQKSQIYELNDIGYVAQRDHAVEVLNQTKIPIYAIAGNHDLYYLESAGANIVEDIASRVPHLTYIGDHEADINCDGVTVKVWHGTDGSSYATSYRLQKIIEAFSGGEKPHILLAAHVHKFCYIFERNIHAVSTGCLQKQTQFMRTKRLAAHVCFCILDFDVKDGKICNFGIQNFPFYA